MKNLASRLSISAQLVLLLTGFALLITLVLAGILNSLFTQRAKEEIGHQFVELATHATDKLDRSLFERYREIQLLVDRTQFGHSQVTNEEKRRILEEMQKTYSFYAWLGITDNAGQVLVSTNKVLEGVNVANRPWFENALKGKHLTDVHDAVLLSKVLRPASSEPMRFIDISFPYHDQSQSIAGVFGAHLSLEWAEEIKKSILLPLLQRNNVETLIVSEDMSVILGPKKLVGTKLSLPEIASASPTQSGYLIEQFADGKNYLVGYSKSEGYSFSPNLGWTVLVRQDVHDAYAPVRQLRQQVVWTGLGIAALFALLGFLLANRISRPLRSIAESAQQIESGEAESIKKIHGGYREIGVLRTALQSLIGKLQASEASMRQADQRKDEFLATLAHELRNPLAPISAIADLLFLAQADEAQQRRLGEVISRQTRHMTGLIDDLLDVSRVTRGSVTIEKRAVNVHDVIAEAVEQVRPLIEAQEHTLELHLPPCYAMVLGDRKRLVQVVANLLDNAAKYTPVGGQIKLALEEQQGRVMLSVRDNGIGMSPGLMDHAFELFTQATRKTDRSKGGLGVGLALSKSLVKLHDGNITVKSDGQGQGTEFIVSLPALEQKTELSQLAAHQTKRLSEKNHLHVLIVDDNSDAADTLGMLVESLGYDVSIAYRPEMAIELARSNPPQICLLDIGMPIMNGYELARQLQQLHGIENVTMIAVTGYGQFKDREKALSAGFDAHLVKPVEIQDLQKCLASVIV